MRLPHNWSAALFLHMQKSGFLRKRLKSSLYISNKTELSNLYSHLKIHCICYIFMANKQKKSRINFQDISRINFQNQRMIKSCIKIILFCLWMCGYAEQNHTYISQNINQNIKNIMHLLNRTVMLSNWHLLSWNSFNTWINERNLIMKH